MLIADDFHSQIILTFLQNSCHIKFTSHKGSLNATKALPIQENIRLPVDTIEIQPLLPIFDGLYLKLITIPEVATEIRLRDLVDIIGIVWIRHSTYINIGSQHSTRHRSTYPIMAVKISTSNLLASGSHLRGSLQTPITTTQFITSISIASHSMRCHHLLLS